MKIDIGLIAVIGAVLIFYLRLIVVQKEKAKQIQRQKSRKGERKGGSIPTDSQVRASILSSNPRDLWVVTGGVLAILFGTLLYSGRLPLPNLQPYWWIPTALGIILFSWGFKP